MESKNVTQLILNHQDISDVTKKRNDQGNDKTNLEMTI